MENDRGYEEFDSELHDEYGYDAHPEPGVELVGELAPGDLPSDAEGLPPVPEEFIPDLVTYEGLDPLDLQPDRGSGSCAEDGPLEVAEDRPMYNGESRVGSAAMYGPTEIGGEYERGYGDAFYKRGFSGSSDPTDDYNRGYSDATRDTQVGAGLYPVDGASEIGESARGMQLGAQHGGYAESGPSEIGAGLYPVDGASEIGHGPYALDGASEIGAGWYPGEGASEIGAGLYPEDGASEIGAGLYPVDGASEIGAGLYPVDGASEIGEEVQSPFESFMMESERIGDWYPGEQEGEFEIGAAQAVAKVVEKARDNRQPAPPMKAVDVDAPIVDDDDGFLSDIVIGAALATGSEQFPLLTQMLQRAGATVEPRIVRVDTEDSYKQFRAEMTPEVAELHEKLEQHINDPAAHSGIVQEDIDDDIADLVHLGAEADEAEAQKRVELWMPGRFEGQIEAFRQGNQVCVSMALPGRDGDVRICTSMEPMAKCIEEMSRHAAEAQVPAAAVVGVLPEMGCVLGAGTALKEMAAAAPAILSRPEAKFPVPFVVRIEPKMAPTLAALVMLVWACKQGNQQACEELRRLGEVSAPQIRQALTEAVEVAKAATGA